MCDFLTFKKNRQPSTSYTYFMTFQGFRQEVTIEKILHFRTQEKSSLTTEIKQNIKKQLSTSKYVYTDKRQFLALLRFYIPHQMRRGFF